MKKTGQNQRDRKMRIEWGILERIPKILLFLVLVLIAINESIASQFEFYPSGWMGDWQDISFNAAWLDDSRPDGTCIRIDYSASGSNGWAGIYWLYPDKNWGDKPGKNLNSANKLTFCAKGERGGELVEFKVGGIKSDSIESPMATGPTKLSTQWQELSIDISHEDRSNIIGGFCWTANNKGNPNGCTIYLDDIKYE